MDSIFRIAVLDSFPNTVIVSFHGGNSDSSFSAFQGDSIYSYFPSHIKTAYPGGIGYGFCYDTIYKIVNSLYNEFPETPVDIEISDKIWNPNTKIIDLSLTIKNDGPELMGSYWYNVIVTEDNIIHMHKTLGGCSTATPPGQPYYDTAYNNNWVTRKMVFWSEGKSLIEEFWPEQQTITQSCSFSLDSAWIPENCNIAVHVYKKADSLYKSPVMQVIQQPVIGWSDISESKPHENKIIAIFPNPAVDITNIHISLTDKGLCSLNIFDLNGNIIRPLLSGNRNPGLYNVEFQTNIIPKGTYLVVLETNTGITSEKIIIQ